MDVYIGCNAEIKSHRCSSTLFQFISVKKNTPIEDVVRFKSPYLKQILPECRQV
jgi:hypothetical protein